MATLPPEVIEQDATLEGQASKASESLAQHRWHWTLDESNPDRVSIREYARQVGRNKQAIAAMVNGYARWLPDGSQPLGEMIQRAKLGAETEAAVEAVAEARGLTFTTAKQHHGDEAKRIRTAAREAVESGKTDDFEGYAKKVAKTIHRGEQAEKQRREDRTQRTSLRYIELDGKIAQARRVLTDGLQIARQDIGWEQDELDLLIGALDALKALTGLIDLALTGALDVDWDGELAKLEA